MTTGRMSLRIGSVSTSTIDVWALAVDRKVDLQRLSFNTLPRRISKIGTFTPRYNTTERLPGFRCESGTYHAFLLACPRGAAKLDCRVDMTSTKEELVGESILSVFFYPIYLLLCVCSVATLGIFMEQRQTI